MRVKYLLSSIKYPVIVLGMIAACVAIFLTGTFGTYSLLSRYNPPWPPSFDVNNLPKAYVIQSGSMEPAIKTASLVLTKPKSQYVPGDIISFTRGDNIITHRVGAVSSGPEKEYKTFGDANEDFDAGIVNNNEIIGNVVLTLPLVGYLVDFAKKPQGFILFVIIPATILVYEEIKSLKRQLSKKLQRSKPQADNVNPDSNNSQKSKGGGLPKVAVAAPILGSLIVLIGISGSFFSDREISPTNVFSASDNPTSIAQTLVINEVLSDSSCFSGNNEAQWIEIYNGYDFAINLKNYDITDGSNTIDLVTAGNIDIPPGGFALLAHNKSIWQGKNACYDNNDVITANLGGTLNIDTKLLQLLNPNGVIIDTVRWGETTGLNPAQDESIEREPNGLDTALGTNFNESDFEVKVPPQPGL